MITVATHLVWMPGPEKLGCALLLKGRGQRAAPAHWTTLSGRSGRSLASWTPGQSENKMVSEALTPFLSCT